MAVSFNANTDAIWSYLYSVIGNEYGVASLMGNLWAESGCDPINVENGFGWTDEAYTLAVDNGTENFMRDYDKGGSWSPLGYGIAQWTYVSRKQALYDRKVLAGVSIGNLQLQLDYLWYELQNSFASTLYVLQNATDIRTASDYVLANFENPQDQSEAVKVERAQNGTDFYNHYAGQPPTPPTPQPDVPIGGIRDVLRRNIIFC